MVADPTWPTRVSLTGAILVLFASPNRRGRGRQGTE